MGSEYDAIIGPCLVCGAVRVDGKCVDPDCFVHDRDRIAALEAEVERLRERRWTVGEPNPIIAVFRSTARTIADLENEYAALEAEVERLREERDEVQALLREVSSELIYGRHPAQGEHHLAGKVRAALGEEVQP